MYPYTSCNGSSDIFAAEKTDSISPDRERLLSLIDTAIDFKQRAADKYFFILDEIKDDDDREIVRSIYIDEIRGKKLLESIKEDIMTGSGIKPAIEAAENGPDNSACLEIDTITITDDNYSMDLPNAFKNMVLEEIEAARFFRDLSAVCEYENSQYLNPISSIINDDQNHAVLSTMLFTAGCKSGPAAKAEEDSTETAEGCE